MQRRRLDPLQVAGLGTALPPGSAGGGRHPEAMNPRWD